MSDPRTLHATAVRVLVHAQAVGAIAGGTLVLVSLAIPWAVADPPDGWLTQDDLDATGRAVVAALGSGMVAVGLFLSGRFRVVAGLVSVALGILVLGVAGSLFNRVEEMWWTVEYPVDVAEGLWLACAGALLTTVSGCAAAANGEPGAVVSTLTGIAIGDARPDPTITHQDRMVWLLGPTAVMLLILALVLGLGWLAGSGPA